MSDSFDEFPLGATSLTHAEAMALCQNPSDCSFDVFPQKATRLFRVDTMKLCSRLPTNCSFPNLSDQKPLDVNDIGPALMTSTPVKCLSTPRIVENFEKMNRSTRLDETSQYNDCDVTREEEEEEIVAKKHRKNNDGTNASDYPQPSKSAATQPRSLDERLSDFQPRTIARQRTTGEKQVKCVNRSQRHQLQSVQEANKSSDCQEESSNTKDKILRPFFGEIRRKVCGNRNCLIKTVALGKQNSEGNNGFQSAETMKETILQHHFGEKRKRVLGDSHCMVKALCLGKLVSDSSNPRFSDVERKKFKKTLYNMTRMDRTLEFQTNAQLQMAKNFLEEAQMDSDQEEHGREDLEVLAAYLEDYQVTLWSIKGRDTVLTEEAHYNKEGKGFIGLFHYKGHYEYVTHIKSGKPSRFCYKCSTWGDTNHTKTCKAKCWFCGFYDCKPEPAIKIHCDDCNIDFPGQECFDRHLKCVTGHAHPNCKKFFYCSNCMRYARTPEYQKRSHVCFTNHVWFAKNKKRESTRFQTIRESLTLSTHID